MAATTSVIPSLDPYTNAILGDHKWASGNLNYSFPTTAASYEVGYGSDEASSNFGALNATQQSAARSAFATYAAVAGLTFSELTGSNAASATLRLAMSDAPSTAWAYLPHTAVEGGDAWFNKSTGHYNNPTQGNYAYITFLHEIGHALGLEHPHENSMPIDRDSMEYSVMSYRSYLGASTATGYTNESWGYAQTLMMYDIAAIQELYGANFSTNDGNTTYSWSSTTGQMSINNVGQGAAGGNKTFQTVWDGGGTDTYDFSNYATHLSIDLRPGYWTKTSSDQLAKLHYSGNQIAKGNIANALQYKGDARSLIENAVGGSGNDTIVGNGANNTFWGNNGNDVFRGNDGNDIIDGGAGRDTALFTGFFRSYTLSGDLANLNATSSAEGSDILFNVEIASFLDGRLITDVSAAAGVAYRMYDAAFNRLPDALGLNDWIAALESGLTANDIADGFVASSEFAHVYGSLTSSGFVRQLYQFVLDREADTAGLNSWVHAIENGSMSRAQVLAGFSESMEHVNLTRAAVEAGVWDINENAAAAARLYYVAFDRAPDAGGLAGWSNAIANGMSLSKVAESFLFSSEFQSIYGVLSNRDLVETLYQNALDRLPDPMGFEAWTTALNNGMERSEVLIGFAESYEHQIKTLSLIDHGIFIA